MLVISIVGLLVLCLCSVRASEKKSNVLDIFETQAVPKIELLRMVHELHELPDEVFQFIILHDVPSLAKTSKSIRTRIQNLSLIQIYLATKYQLPSLATLDFHPDLLKIESLLWNGKPRYGDILSPEILHQRIELNFESSPLIDEILLRLYDHFAENPPQNLYLSSISGIQLAKHVFQLILTNRPLAFYERINGLLSEYTRDLRFSRIPNISAILVRWLSNEPDVFYRLFLDSASSSCSREVFLLFVKIPGVKLPTNLRKEDAQNLIFSLDKWMFDPEFNEPESDQIIFNLWSDYLKNSNNFDLEFDPEFELKLNLRFNRDHKYIQPENIEDYRLDDLVVLLVFAGKYDQATELLIPGLEINELCKRDLMNRPEFCIYLMSNKPEVYRSCFDDLPREVYDDPSGLELVLAFHQVSSVDELFDYLAAAFFECNETKVHQNIWGFSKCINLAKFAIRFGTAEHFRRAFNPQTMKYRQVDTDILNNIIHLKHQSDDFKAFIEFFIQGLNASSGMIHLSPSSIEILLGHHPETLMKLENCNRIVFDLIEFKHI